MRAAELTRQMLAFSRRQMLQPTVLDLNIALSKVEQMLRRVIGEDIELTVTGKAGRALVRVDPGQIEQVIDEPGRQRPRRDAERRPPDGRDRGRRCWTTDVARRPPDARPGPYVLLAVTDTGIGMSPAVRARIFEPYFTTKAVGQGHRPRPVHRLWHRPAERRPHHRRQRDRAWARRSASCCLAPKRRRGRSRRSVQKLPGGTEHILVVEDDASVRRLAKDLLTRLGYSVTEAASGRAGIALGSDDTRHFDLVLCDVILGDMSGPAVAEALVALRPSIRVLYMSGYTDDAIVRTGVLDEGKSFLQKPFTPVQLARKIREVLEEPETDADDGQTVSHYRIVERSAAVAWAWSTPLKTRGSAARSRSSFCPTSLLRRRKRWSASCARRAPSRRSIIRTSARCTTSASTTASSSW